MLEYLVQAFLTGHHCQIKEYSIALDVFDRSESFEPCCDPIVRVEASRLRKKLDEHYESEGKAASIRIELPKGHYLPVIRPILERRERGETVTERAYKSIIVLPFSLYGNTDGTAENISTAVRDQLLHQLTRTARVRVVSRLFSAQVEARMGPQMIGAHCGAQLIMEGVLIDSVLDRTFVIYLVEAATGYNLWSGSYKMAATLEETASQIVLDFIVFCGALAL